MGCLHKQPSPKRSPDNRQIRAQKGTAQFNSSKAFYSHCCSSAYESLLYDKFVRNLPSKQVSKPEGEA